MQRRSQKREEIAWVTEYDIFPKVEKEFQATTKSGGLVSIVIWAVLFYLVFSEYVRYSSISLDYEFQVDKSRDFESTMDVNIDITVKMDCERKIPLIQTCLWMS